LIENNKLKEVLAKQKEEHATVICEKDELRFDEKAVHANTLAQL
jgi:hypothetical protein